MHRFKPANIYKLTIKKVNDNKSEYLVETLNGNNGFAHQDLSQGGKIYMVIYPDELGSTAYVGQTKRSMEKRFYDGVKRQGYKWAQSSSLFFLFVWDVNDFTRDASHELDSIESELTFACRLNQGAWPLLQTSIKFRWFRQSETAKNAPYIVIKMMNNLYDFLSQKSNNIKLVEAQRERTNSLLKQAAIAI